MDNLTLAGQINYKKITDGEPIYQEFQKMSKEPMKYNTDLLMKILSDNKDTEYGKKHQFADIHSIEEFQEKVPVSRYDDYVDYILRETEGNEKHLLCAYDVTHYNKSSGTMGNPKRLPMSDKAIEIFGKYNNGYMNALLADKLGIDWING